MNMKLIEFSAAPKTVENVQALARHVSGRSSNVKTSFNSGLNAAGIYRFKVRKCAKTGKVLEVLDREIELNPNANMFQLAKVYTHEMKHERDLLACGHEFEERDRDGLERSADRAEHEFERESERIIAREIDPRVLEIYRARQYSRAA